jgi:hypothetical protein
MSELPEQDRVSEMLRRLEELQQESVALRHRIHEINSAVSEFPPRDTRPQMFDEAVKPDIDSPPRRSGDDRRDDR